MITNRNQRLHSYKINQKAVRRLIDLRLLLASGASDEKVGIAMREYERVQKIADAYQTKLEDLERAAAQTQTTPPSSDVSAT